MVPSDPVLHLVRQQMDELIEITTTEVRGEPLRNLKS